MDLDCRNGPLQFAQNYRISRRRMGGFVGELENFGRSKARGQSLETPCSIFPIGIAACSAQQVYLPFRTFQKRLAQFRDKGLIVPHCSC